MGNLQVDLGQVQYDSDSLLSPVPLAAQVSLAAGAAVIILSVLVVILMYRYRRPSRPFLSSQDHNCPDRPAWFVGVLLGGRVNKLSETTRRFCFSWKLWRSTWEISVERSSPVQEDNTASQHSCR